MRGLASITAARLLTACILVLGNARLFAQTPAARPAMFSSYRQAQTDDDVGRKHRQRVIWGSILAGTVGATVLGDWANGGIDFPEAAIPVAGPFIALARYDNVVTSPFYQGRSADKVLFAASGVVQAISLVMILRTLRGGGEEQFPSRRNAPDISIAPLGRRGFLVSYKTRP